MTNTRGSRVISSRRAWLRASRYVITAISRLLEDVGEELLQRRLRGGVREGHRLVDEVVDVLLDALHLILAEQPRRARALAEEEDGVPLLLALDLLPRPVDGAGRIAHGVPAEPVGPRLEERRRLVLPRAGDGPDGRLAHRQHVHAVHGLARDAVGRAELPDL